ncbi:aldehyde dehydrogenase family protein [Streptomyces sp. MST-110588]|uniref:aldehyde dehydrogenase family protein n=1 Tax=Streptomyces sp. MST-110588 TaxID=2833628 RepID=UPI003242E95D
MNEPYAAAYASVDAPMGGMKDSGVGRRHGRDGLLSYTEAQTVATQRLLPLTPPDTLSGQSYATFVTRLLLLAKHLRA